MTGDGVSSRGELWTRLDRGLHAEVSELKDPGERRVGQREGARPGDGSGHVGDAIVDHPVQWKIWEEYRLELRQQIQQEMEVATSESAIYRCQGKLVLLRQILNLPTANKRHKEGD